MKRRKIPHSPAIVGMGLITLDLVVDNVVRNETRLFAGGTCGNVLTILSYLGWESIPVSRLRNDCAAKYVIDDLGGWGVSLDYLSLYPRANTPIIVQQLHTNTSGDPSHSYSFVCPKCQAFLPSFRPVTNSSLDEVIDNIDSPQVFFFDRVSRSSLTLAKYFKKKGSIVYFEPSGVGKEEMFEEAVKLSDIVKYARNRGRRIRTRLEDIRPPVEIETLGSQGVRYRSAVSNLESKDWTNVASISSSVVDTSGAGDWFTSGLIDSLFRYGRPDLKQISAESFLTAIKRSQTLSARACEFVGPRGLMYEGEGATLDPLENIVRFRTKKRARPESSGQQPPLADEYGCPKCCTSKSLTPT